MATPYCRRGRGVLGGQLHRAVHGAHQVGTGQGEAQCGPALHGVRSDRSGRRLDGRHVDHRVDGHRGPGQIDTGGHAAELHPGQMAAVGSGHQEQRRGRSRHIDRHRRRQLAPATGAGHRGEIGVQGHGLERRGVRGPGQPPELAGHDRAEERHVGQAPTKLLGHDGRFHSRCHGLVLFGGGPELPPSRGGHRGIELGRPFRVAEVSDGVRAELPDQPGRGVPKRLLLLGVPDVHQALWGAEASRSDHWSRRVRRSTLPDGRRGISSTTTTWCRRL